MLEAFSKFGSDLDPATMAVLDKGRKNVEILKQPLHTPYTVDKQIAIIYCGTNGLLRNVPREKVQQFESEFLDEMQINHKDVLDLLASGKIDDAATSVIRATAAEVSKRFA